MKKILVLLVAVATMFAQNVFAQSELTAEQKKAAAKAKREELMKTRLELLKAELKLSEEQFVNFDPVYRRYRAEIQKVTSMNRDARIKRDSITNENALRVVSARLANDALNTAVKQRYVMIFAEVIEPLQVMKLYRVEGKISREANKIMKSRAAAANGSN